MRASGTKAGVPRARKALTMRAREWWLWVGSLLLLLLSGCLHERPGGGSSFAVVSTSPAAGAEDVSPLLVIEVLFSEVVGLDTVDDASLLVETSAGEIGTPIEKFLLFTCFRFDPEANSYVVSAYKLMQFGGALTILAIITLLLFLKMRGDRTPQLTGLQT